jgi:hypothetical protein
MYMYTHVTTLGKKESEIDVHLTSRHKFTATLKISMIIADSLGTWLDYMYSPTFYYKRAKTRIRETQVGPPYICCLDVNASNSQVMGWENLYALIRSYAF